jgi:hypothetical protein
MLDIIKHISKPYLLFTIEQNNFVVTELNTAYLNYSGVLTKTQFVNRILRNYSLFFQNECISGNFVFFERGSLY